MINWKKLLAGLVTGVILVYGITVLRAWKRGPLDCFVTTTYVDSFVDLKTKSKAVFETNGNISGIELSINGLIQGTGILSVAYNDTTVHKEYKLDSGIVYLNHKSDWYAGKCLVTFTPTTPAEGKLEISCNFIGD